VTEFATVALVVKPPWVAMTVVTASKPPWRRRGLPSRASTIHMTMPADEQREADDVEVIQVLGDFFRQDK